MFVEEEHKNKRKIPVRNQALNSSFNLKELSLHSLRVAGCRDTKFVSQALANLEVESHTLSCNRQPRTWFKCTAEKCFMERLRQLLIYEYTVSGMRILHEYGTCGMILTGENRSSRRRPCLIFT